MTVTPSTMLKLGTPAPDFRLPDTSGREVSPADFSQASALLVMFICNHCPYVKHIRHGIADFVREYQAKGLAAVGINANDVSTHPHDSPVKMAEEVKATGYTFSYLFDKTQAAAKNYRAACTPDFFLFNKERRLVYRGQFDDSRPGSDKPVTGADMRAAVDAVLTGGTITRDQIPSMGCNIKWKAGNEPDYYG